MRFIQPIYTALPDLMKHPFHLGLQKGTLDQRVFNHFLRQDLFYLRAYSGVLRQIANRMELEQDKKLFIELSEYIARTEMKSHKHFLNSNRFFSTPPTSFLKKGEAVTGYINFLQRNAQYHPVEVSVASVLPCFVLYKELGVHVVSANTPKNNPYYFWLRSYSSEQFVKFADKLSVTAQNLTEHCDPFIYEDMNAAIKASIGHEKSIWDEAIRETHQPNGLTENQVVVAFDSSPAP